MTDPYEPESMLEAEIRKVEEPARLLRMSTMVSSLLDEARDIPLDENARDHLQRIQEQAVREIGDSVSPELRDELARLLPEPSVRASQAEIRITQSQLVGWLTGVFQGIRAGMALQQATEGDHRPPAQPGPGQYL